MNDSPERNRPVVAVAIVDAPPPGLPEAGSGARYSFAGDEAQLREVLQDAEILFAWSYWIPAFIENFKVAEHLRWIHVAGIGVESLLSPDLVRSDVIVSNSSGAYARTMAEYAVMLMLQFAKDAVSTVEDQRAHRWNWRETDTLEGRELLVMGTGPIGRGIARLARGLGLRTIGLARSQRHGDDDFEAIHASDALHDVIGSADYVVLAAPLTPATQGIIGRDALHRMKRTARLINLGRGALVDESALVEALRSNQIAGAALDAFWSEPLAPDHPLWDMPNVIISPHMSGDVADTSAGFVRIFLENLSRWQAGQPLSYVIDKSLGFAPTHRARL